MRDHVVNAKEWMDLDDEMRTWLWHNGYAPYMEFIVQHQDGGTFDLATMLVTFAQDMGLSAEQVKNSRESKNDTR